MDEASSATVWLRAAHSRICLLWVRHLALHSTLSRTVAAEVCGYLPCNPLLAFIRWKGVSFFDTDKLTWSTPIAIQGKVKCDKNSVYTFIDARRIVLCSSTHHSDWGQS